MSAFKLLRDVCNNFNEELQRSSKDLFAAKVGESFEDCVGKKLRDLSLFTSKLRLLQAKPLALDPRIAEDDDNKDVMKNYSELAVDRVIEQQVVKSLTYSQHVRELLTAPNSNLDPELIERKEKIIDQLSKYRHQETELRNLTTVLSEREEELAEVRERWEHEMQEFRLMRGSVDRVESIEETGPIHKKLVTLTEKMELMRWLISKLVTSRVGQYDWLADPQHKMAALKLTRQHNTIDKYTSSI